MQNTTDRMCWIWDYLERNSHPHAEGSAVGDIDPLCKHVSIVSTFPLTSTFLSVLVNPIKRKTQQRTLQVLAALCNLSLSGCIGQDPARFLKAVDVGNLVSFLCSADVTYRLFGAVTLGNIASDVSLQAPIVRGGALTPLITIANAADLETQRCIAYSLCNLSANPARRGAIISEGGLPSLISLACSDHPVDQRAALATLRAIAADPDHRRAVVEAGALEAFSLGARYVCTAFGVSVGVSFGSPPPPKRVKHLVMAF